MRRWGLYGLSVLVLAMILLSGCGSGDDNNADANYAASNGADFGAAEKAMANTTDMMVSGGVVETTSAQEAPAAQADGKSKGGGQDATAVDAATNNNNIGAGFTGSDVVAGLNKKLIYKANLNMEVEEYGKAQTEVRNLVTLAGGYIIEFTENMSEYEQGGTFILKVPASGFSPFLNNLEKVKHESLQRSIQGQDVSEEYVDLESRLKAKVLMEIQYTEFMKKATKSSDLVAFANELGTIQESIEQIKGRMRYIDQNVSFSTVELRLYQTDESVRAEKKIEQGPLMERASDALNGSLNVLSTLFQWLVVILAAALPVLIGAAMIFAIVLLVRKNTRTRRGHRDEHSRQIRQANRNQDVTNVEADEEDSGEK
ncbi:DUF4349 domain-containing protein [Paenibacillus sp. sgz500958]|uniref:DUF4349 domain-containing protein n=1 Tax=Paenibacillus sp. sgz500958 TaxID=3242475 RepID=UPI0036D39287